MRTSWYWRLCPHFLSVSRLRASTPQCRKDVCLLSLYNITSLYVNLSIKTLQRHMRRPDPIILFPALILFPVSDLTLPLFFPLVSPRSACTLGRTPSPAVPVTTPSTSPRGCWDSTRTISKSSTRCPNSVSRPKASSLTRPRKWWETASRSWVDSVYLILLFAVFPPVSDYRCECSG